MAPRALTPFAASPFDYGAPDHLVSRVGPNGSGAPEGPLAPWIGATVNRLSSRDRLKLRSLLEGSAAQDRLSNVAPALASARGSSRPNIVVNAAPPPAPAPAMNPAGSDEDALVRQAGFATANSAIAPLLGDWRATPVQILAAAIGGYGRGAYGAKQDIAAGKLQQAQAQAAQDKLARQKEADDQIKAAIAEIAKTDPERARTLGLLYATGDEQGLTNLLAPPQRSRQITGSERTGFYSVDPNDPSNVTQIIPAASGLTPAEQEAARRSDRSYQLEAAKFEYQKTHPGGSNDSYRMLSPDEVSGLGLPAGPYQVNAKGEIKPISVRGETATAGERTNQRLADIVAKVQNQGGFQGIPQEDVLWYERQYRKAAAPRAALDPNTGLITQTNADVSDLPLPPSMQPNAGPIGTQELPPTAPPATTGAASPVAVAPSGGEDFRAPAGAGPVPAPERPQAAPPVPPVAYGPTAGRTSVQQSATKEQMKDFNDSISARNDLNAATKRMRELLAEGNGLPAVMGDRARKMRVASQQIVTSLGALGKAGTMQPSDIDRYTKMLGDVNSPTEFAINALGISHLGATLDELDRTVNTRVLSRAKETGRNYSSFSEEEADKAVGSLPPGAFFIGPDGQLHQKK